MKLPDLGSLLAQAREVQKRIADVQRELARRTAEASAGAGLVTAVASGDLRIREVRIDPELLARGDAQMIQDLVVSAVNAALEAARRLAEEELQRVAGGLPPGPGTAGTP